MSSFSDAVAQGIVPAPNTRMMKVQFTYNTGATLLLEGDSLSEWFSNYLRMLQISYVFDTMQQQRVQQEQQREQENSAKPIVRGDAVRQWLEQVENKERGLSVNSKDDNKK